MISLAKSLELKIVAEGVETEAQVEKLLEFGCECAQGYVFSKPLSAKHLEELIGNKNCNLLPNELVKSHPIFTLGVTDFTSNLPN